MSASPQPPRPPAAAGGQPPTVVVICGGDPLPESALSALQAEQTHAIATIAADSGLDEATRWGLHVDRIVGDLDSVDPGNLEAARAAGVPIDTYPQDKDRTDLAIALDTALEHRPQRIVVFGGAGGRLDHLLGNASLLTASTYAGIEMLARMGDARVTVIHGGRTRPTQLTGQVGEVLSLLPFHGDARGVTTTGLRFPLTDALLPSGSSLGVSNEFTTTSASVAITDGVLLAVQPDMP